MLYYRRNLRFAFSFSFNDGVTANAFTHKMLIPIIERLTHKHLLLMPSYQLLISNYQLMIKLIYIIAYFFLNTLLLVLQLFF